MKPEDYIGRAQKQMEEGRLHGAAEEYDKAIEVWPKSADLYTKRAEVRRKLGDVSGALADVSRAIDLDTTSAAALTLRGDMKLQSGNLKGALEDADRAIQRNAGFADPFMTRALAKASLGNLQGAIADFDHVISLDPMKGAAYRGRGGSHAHLGQLPAALEDYTKLVDLEPNVAKNTIIQHAVQLEDHFRNLGLHCGGVVLVPEEIRRYVPVEISAKGLPVIQWDKDQTEDGGLVKIDLLGNRSLAVIRDALAAIARNTGRHIEYATWDPLSDEATKALICQGDTLGCFYIESPATRLLLRKLWAGMPEDRRAAADVFEYLVIVSSLVRPAANTFVEEFLRHAHGKPYRPLHPVLDTLLAETHGIMTYQEDVTKVAMELAGFSIDDGDQLRKVLSKKHKAKRLREYQQQFYEGAGARGVSLPVITTIWQMIMSFAGYSFCKPHSASYAQVSFKSAYLRRHYPAEFMAAVISNQGGFYSTQAYLSEARRMGLTILPPDINDSEWGYRGRGKTIRVGLMQLKTLQKELAEQIVNNRKKDGAFRSLQNFLERIQPAPSQTRVLIKAGCFDSIAGELTRPALLWRLLTWNEHSFRSYVPVPPEYSRRQRLNTRSISLASP